MVISVIVPNYNTGPFLDACLDSVVSQNYAQTEIIMVDGKSTDNSHAIINKYAKYFAHIIIEKDSGQAEAINKGFAVSTGDIMCWLNADDVFRTGALALVNNIFTHFKHIAWITGRRLVIDESGEVIQDGPPADLTRIQVLSGSYKWIQQESTFWRRRLWKAVGSNVSEQCKLAVDLDLWLRMFEKDRLYPVSAHLGAFRKRRNQRSQIFQSDYEHEARQLIDEARKRVSKQYKQNYQDLLSTPARFISQKELVQLHPEALSESLKPIFVNNKQTIVNPNPEIVSPNTINLEVDHNSGDFIADYLLIARNTSTGDDLHKFRAIHSGERCWIMGNGPSLRQMDLDCFADEIVLGSNSVYLMFDQISWRPRYHCCVDTRVLPDTHLEILDMLRQHAEIIGFYPSELPIYDNTGRTIDTRLLLESRPNLFYFKSRNMNQENLPDSAFSLDLNSYLCTPNTVTIALMQIAVYMGFTDLYLIGCDTSYTIPQSVKQAGPAATDGGKEQLLLTSTADDDCNHFSPKYFGKGRKWHHPKTEAMIRHYGFSKQVLDEAGVSVFNATVGGNLEVFDRVDYLQVLGKG
jgi:glycosyltransferase involved in cell wall biosynthesis